MAQTYGRLFAIFPIGKFEWVCNTDHKYGDLTDAYNKFKTEQGLDNKDNTATVLFMDELKKLKTWKHNEGLTECLNSGSEIMIKCDKFYAIWGQCPLKLTELTGC